MSNQYYDDVDDQEMEPAYAETSNPYTHMTKDDLFGVQTKTFNVSLDGNTLEQLKTNAKDGYLWNIPEELKTLLRHIKKTKNRDNVTSEDLEGNLGKALFLGAKVKSHRSTAPIAIAMNVPGLVPQTFTKNGVHCHVIPANVPYTVLNKDIFSPKNIFNEYMYKHNKKCDMTTLNQHIKLDHDKEKKTALMDSRGVGWKVLMDNIEGQDYEDVYEDIMSTNAHIIEGSTKSRWAEVPYQTALEIYDAIAAPLKEIEQSYTDMNGFAIKLSREDGREWNDMNGLTIDSHVHGEESVGYEKEQKIHTPFQVDVELEVEYILNQ
jgi:hypothetical protein